MHRDFISYFTHCLHFARFNCIPIVVYNSESREIAGMRNAFVQKLAVFEAKLMHSAPAPSPPTSYDTTAVVHAYDDRYRKISRHNSYSNNSSSSNIIKDLQSSHGDVLHQQQRSTHQSHSLSATPMHPRQHAPSTYSPPSPHISTHDNSSSMVTPRANAYNQSATALALESSPTTTDSVLKETQATQREYEDARDAIKALTRRLRRPL